MAPLAALDIDSLVEGVRIEFRVVGDFVLVTLSERFGQPVE